jgi:hypothetical protein
VRREEVAAFAAGADAHVTGELVVCAGVAYRAVFISLTGSSTVAVGEYRSLPLQRRFHAAKSAPAISRRPMPSLYSRTAAITVNWFRLRR